MRGIIYQFKGFQALSLHLEAGSDEQELELPPGAGPLANGEWVLAQFFIGEETTSIAACAVDRGDGLRLAFEDRDWERLWQFANRDEPPTIPPPSAPPTDDTEIPPHTRILVVDDDRDTQRMLRELLESAGYAASIVASAEEAFDRLRDMQVDLVVLDWSLPGMSGIDFCKRIRRDSVMSRLPVLFLTAHSSSHELVTAFEAGADDYVRKPFRALELKARILGLLRRSKMQPHVVRA